MYLVVGGVVGGVYLVVGGVVESSDDRFVVSHDSIFDFLFHFKNSELIVESDEETVDSVVEVQHTRHYNNNNNMTSRVLLSASRYSLTFWSFREHSGQTLNTHLQLDVPNAKDFVFRETDELTARFVELHLNDGGHVTSKHLRHTLQLQNEDGGQETGVYLTYSVWF